MQKDLEKVADFHSVVEEDKFFGSSRYIKFCHPFSMNVIFFIGRSKKSHKNGVRWHPLFIRWYLNIMLTSSKTYEIMRDSGFVSLPSKRTLRDYTYWINLEPEFNAKVFKGGPDG